jgi:hypothetical protein
MITSFSSTLPKVCTKPSHFNGLYILHDEPDAKINEAMTELDNQGTPYNDFGFEDGNSGIKRRFLAVNDKLGDHYTQTTSQYNKQKQAVDATIAAIPEKELQDTVYDTALVKFYKHLIAQQLQPLASLFKNGLKKQPEKPSADFAQTSGILTKP